MSRHTRPACHGRPMRLDPRTRQWVCARCGAWTTRLTARTEGGAL